MCSIRYRREPVDILHLARVGAHELADEITSRFRDPSPGKVPNPTHHKKIFTESRIIRSTRTGRFGQVHR
jgi:hypothetical protein